MAKRPLPASAESLDPNVAVAEFKLTPLGAADIEDIAGHTLTTWGKAQCRRYLDELQACFQELAIHPNLGRKCDRIRPGLMRFETGRHVVFYRQRPYGVRIIRVLHQQMLPDLQALDDKE